MFLRTQYFIAIIFLFFCCSSSQIKDFYASKYYAKKEQLFGYAVGKFKIGSVLFNDKLNNQITFQKNWIVQLSPEDPDLIRYAKVENDSLQVHDPRGCSIWFKQKLRGPIMISYYVYAPEKYNKGFDIVPRDINQFCMANTPNTIDPYSSGGLFDSKVYDGNFKSYDQLTGYYASTGGGTKTVGNKTTRMRRYPRVINNENVNHVALCLRDNNKDFLISPNQRHHIQMVVADDIVQYIFDEKIVYELKKGDQIDIMNDLQKDVKVAEGVWGDYPWTFYNEGYFGFRMTRTHHVYYDFKVYKLINK